MLVERITRRIRMARVNAGRAAASIHSEFPCEIGLTSPRIIGSRDASTEEIITKDCRLEFKEINTLDQF